VKFVQIAAIVAVRELVTHTSPETVTVNHQGVGLRRIEPNGRSHQDTRHGRQ
jgi:hypothetical protein